MATPAPLIYRVLRAAVGGLLRLFFREIAVEGRRHVPQGRGGLLVAWHPNGIIDPALILARFPGRIVFGARDGLLRWPLLGPLMRALGTVPIYRPQDAGAGTDEAARRAANTSSLDALATEIAGGSYAALFPEGISHDLPYVADIRTGAARLYARALVLSGGAPPALVPVGLHYDAKSRFRSRALVAFHAPLRVTPETAAALAGDDEAAREAAVDDLTARIERALVYATGATESWELHHAMHDAASLVRAESARRAGVRAGEASPVVRALGFAQIWHGYAARRATHPADVEALAVAVDAYARRRETLGLTDADLDAPPPLARTSLVAQAALVFLLLPPLAAIGWVVNVGPHLALKALARRLARAQKDAATVKLLGGLVLYPLAWLAAAALVVWAGVRLDPYVPWLPDAPVAAALWVVLLSAVGGVVALRYVEMARATWRSLTVRLTRARRQTEVAYLRERRAALHDRLVALADGLDLPDTVTDPVGRDADDGR